MCEQRGIKMTFLKIFLSFDLSVSKLVKCSNIILTRVKWQNNLYVQTVFFLIYRDAHSQDNISVINTNRCLKCATG